MRFGGMDVWMLEKRGVSSRWAVREEESVMGSGEMTMMSQCLANTQERQVRQADKAIDESGRAARALPGLSRKSNGTAGVSGIRDLDLLLVQGL